MEKTRTWVSVIRWVGALLFAAIAAMCVPALLAASWMKNDVLNTAEFVETLHPLSASPQFHTLIAQSAADQVSSAVSESVSVSTVEGLASGTASFLDMLPFGTNLSQSVEEFTTNLDQQVYTITEEQTRTFLQSDLFPPLWKTGLREVHSELVGTLSGAVPPALGESGEAVLTIQIGPLAEVLKQTLTDQGQWWARLIPQIEAEVPIVELADLPTLQRYYALAENADVWILAVAIASLVLAVGLAPRRLLIVGVSGLMAFVTTAFVWWKLPAFGLEHIRVLTDENAVALSEQVWGMLTAPLIASLQQIAGIALIVSVLALVVALITYLWGSRRRPIT